MPNLRPVHEKSTGGSPYRPRLIVHVVWHPEFGYGRELAERIYAHFARDPERPNSRSLGIPVFFHHGPAPGQAAPLPIGFDDAQHTVVIVLVDPKLVIGGAWWKTYIGDLWRHAQAAPARHRLLPVALTPSAHHLLAEAHFIRLDKCAPEARPGVLLNRLTNELARLVTHQPALASVEAEGMAATGETPRRMRLFLSHAKLDGEKTALALRTYIHENLALETFFDAVDIAAGFRFEDQLHEGIDNAAFAVIHTDAYASRVWCQHEVIRAKRLGRPLVVIHAIEHGEARAFPYIGNVPTIRWRADEPARVEAVVGAVLLEVLRNEYFLRHFEDLKALFNVPSGVRALPCAPELLTALALRGEDGEVPYYVYPDPPLGKQEIHLVNEMAPGLRLITPTLLFSNPARPEMLAGAGTERALNGWRVGLSISKSEDLAALGMGLPKLPGEAAAPDSVHLRDAMVELARFCLAAGATLAYGGDLRQGGFTQVLFELVAAHRSMGEKDNAAIQSYLGWPIYLDLSEEQEAGWSGLVDFHKVPPPDDLGVDPAIPLPPSTAGNRVAWARSLTAMRAHMNRETHARVFIGGQSRGLGRYPGIAEEVLLALRAGRPVYLLGAFGGCTRAVIEAINGRKPPTLTLDHQAAEPANRDMIELYNSQCAPGAEPIDYPALTSEFERAGISGLNNGLNVEENERLFSTVNLPEMAALVLRGLHRLGKPSDLDA